MEHTVSYTRSIINLLCFVWLKFDWGIRGSWEKGFNISVMLFWRLWFQDFLENINFYFIVLYWFSWPTFGLIWLTDSMITYSGTWRPTSWIPWMNLKCSLFGKLILIFHKFNFEQVWLNFKSALSEKVWFLTFFKSTWVQLIFWNKNPYEGLEFSSVL